MHPDIKKFWENAGWTMSSQHDSNDPYLSRILYTIEKSNMSFHVADICKRSGNNYYFFPFNNFNSFSEEKALRLVRLKVFM